MLSPAANAAITITRGARWARLNQCVGVRQQQDGDARRPARVTTIGDGPSPAARLTEAVIPESVQTSTGVVERSLEMVEYGTKVRSIRMGSWVPDASSSCAVVRTVPSSTMAARRTDVAKARFSASASLCVLRRGRAAVLPAGTHPPLNEAGFIRRSSPA